MKPKYTQNEGKLLINLRSIPSPIEETGQASIEPTSTETPTCTEGKGVVVSVSLYEDM